MSSQTSVVNDADPKIIQEGWMSTARPKTLRLHSGLCSPAWNVETTRSRWSCSKNKANKIKFCRESSCESVKPRQIIIPFKVALRGVFLLQHAVVVDPGGGKRVKLPFLCLRSKGKTWFQRAVSGVENRTLASWGSEKSVCTQFGEKAVLREFAGVRRSKH